MIVKPFLSGEFLENFPQNVDIDITLSECNKIMVRKRILFDIVQYGANIILIRFSFVVYGN